MKITKEEVLHVASLARLKFSDEDAQKLEAGNYRLCRQTGRAGHRGHCSHGPRHSHAKRVPAGRGETFV